MFLSAQTKRIIVCAGCLLLLYGALLSVFPVRAELAEANYQANLIRLQAYLFHPPPKAVLVGSSISGRMVPSYFDKTAVQPMANLGIDGAGCLFGLEVVLNHPTQIVVVETNRLCTPSGANEAMLRDATEGFSFAAARVIPMFRAGSRPSSILYSWAKKRQDAAGMASRWSPSAKREEISPGVQAIQLPPGYEETRRKVRSILVALRDKGMKIVLVRVPVGVMTGFDQAGVQAGTEFARELSLPSIDLAAECSERKWALTYTDGTHMTPSSARQTSELLAELVAAETK